jgi:predicted acylesterase/phospholipase RssA
VLSLWGGGFRGLFTARVLERMEADGGPPLRDRFDLIGGTSVGAILALGLAHGVPARRLRETLQARGPGIFRPRPLSFGGLLRARYDAAGVAAAVRELLGPAAEAPLADAPAAVVVVAVDQRAARPAVLTSRRAAPDGRGDPIAVVDAALATSAAPTYFPPHRTGDAVLVDGGLIANAPDLLLAATAIRRHEVPLAALRLCSIGTAGGQAPRPPARDPGALGWLRRHGLVELTVDAQAALSAELSSGLLPRGTLRVDATPAKPIALDDASPAATRTLLALADEAAARAERTAPAAWRRFLDRRTG